MELFLSIEHVAIAARDPKALAEWYSRVLGFSTHISFDNGPDKPRTFMMKLGNGPMIEIIPSDATTPVLRNNSQPGWIHAAILVSDFDRAHSALNEAGARREGEERAAPFGARVQFYRDPEGNLFHILFRPAPLPQDSGS